MAPVNGPSGNTNRRSQQHLATRPTPNPRWQVGEIAFLKPASEFTESECIELLDTGRVPPNATGHPVIILDRSEDSRYFIVTTVSAYGSSEDNNHLPPWEQRTHSKKDINSFRAFEGSAKPNNKFQHLRLADNKSWPKPKTSWVYIQRPSLVPASALIYYTKSRYRLQMTTDSLQDLLGHMEAESGCFRKLKKEITGKADLKEKKGGAGGKRRVLEGRKHHIKHQRSTNKANRSPKEVPLKTIPAATKSPAKMTSGRAKPSSISKIAGGNPFALLAS
ncbi:hypothetical protein F5Y10DRAFT_284969 [Nemania abortiva]|nr:hypothetical protein F5Y10DRAFT_284969 [Nemania abortiva]